MSDENPIAVLMRWEEFGGTWEVVDQDGERVTIALRRCDGGEQVDEVTSDRPDLIAWLAGRTRP